MSRFCLDTSAYSQFRRGDREVRDLVDTARWVGVPSIVVGELLSGFQSGARSRENRQVLMAFLSEPAVSEITVDREVAAHYADIYAELRTAGTPIPTNDMWVAACAAAAGVPVVSYDTHFSRIRRIACWLLKPSG